MKVMTILGTRPEIIKLSPLIPLLDKEFKHVLVHTGQHYDYEMDSLFFKELNLRDPDFNLKVGSSQKLKITEKLEGLMEKEGPDLVIVFGDTNSTAAGSLAASKLKIKLAHIEAGCRSFNKDMPEEKNRILSDHLADYLFVLNQEDFDNLLKEGIKREKIFLVGSLLIDACLRNKKLAEKADTSKRLGLRKEEYILVTTHRAENTNPENLRNIFGALNELAKTIEIVMPIHPRTKKSLIDNNIEVGSVIKIIEPVGYIEFLNLLINSKFVITDSGGVQEEVVILNKPCLILRDETELKSFKDAGKIILVGASKDKILQKANELIENNELEKIKAIKMKLMKDVGKNIMSILTQISST